MKPAHSRPSIHLHGTNDPRAIALQHTHQDSRVIILDDVVDQGHNVGVDFEKTKRQASGL